MKKNFINKILSFGYGKGFEQDDHNAKFNPSAEFSPFQLKTLSTEDYLNFYKGWTYVAVSAVAEAVAGLDRNLRNDKGENIESDVMNLLSYEFLNEVTSYLRLAGSVYIWKNMLNGQVVSLHILRPDLVKIKYNKAKKELEYEYQHGEYKHTFEQSEIIPINLFNPRGDYRIVCKGIGPVEASATAVETDNQAGLWNRTFFDKGAQPGFILHTDNKLTSDVLGRLKDSFNNEYRGTKNSHKLMVLEGGLKAQFNPSQKEMEFIEQRRMSRDEILAIHKVPKAVLGLGEGNNLNVKTFDSIFAERTIKPTAKVVESALNEHLFKGIGKFSFVNIVPVDDEKTRKDYDSGIMLLNEIRETRGLKPLKGGNVLKSTEFQMSEEFEYETDGQSNGKKTSKLNLKAVAEKSIKKAIKELNSPLVTSEEKEEKRHSQKILRADIAEKRRKAQLLKIFKRQEKDVLKQMGKKSVKLKLPKLDLTKYLTLYLTLITPESQKIIKEESKEAFTDVGQNNVLDVKKDEAVVNYIKSSIIKFATEVDELTNDKMQKQFEEGIEKGESTDQIVERIGGVFKELKTSRTERIIRAETIRAGTFAQTESWEQSGVVAKKQWYTALDERVCEYCQPLHGKTISLKGDFFKKGQTYTGRDGGKLKLDYSDTPGSPLHPNCRCNLIPVIE